MQDVYGKMTARILTALQAGVVPWQQPWNGGEGAPRNLISGKPYRGLNVWLLANRGGSPFWLTYRQARQIGGYVKKGAKGETVLFWQFKARKRSDEGQAEDARCYTEEGAEGSRSSNLSYAGTGQYSVDPAGNMLRWTHDAGNIGHISSVGHRRWMLNPFATYLSYGQVYGHSAQKVFGFDDEPPVSATVDVDYVAFPFQTYPALFMAPDPPWSFTVIEDKNDPWGNRYPYFEGADVSVARADTGENLVITDRARRPAGGVLNVLSWQVEGWEYDTLYEVEISNVVLQNGDTRDYSYTVFIDRAAGSGL